MKKIFVAVSFLFLGTEVFAQEQAVLTPAVKYAKLDNSPLDAILFQTEASKTDKTAARTPLIKVYYSRPQKKGREIFGSLEPYGTMWRLGANECTEVIFYTDVVIDGKKIKAGTYSLFAIPNKEKWTIVINKKTNVWGTYDYDDKLDVLRTDVKLKTLDTEIEALSMAFSKTETGAKLFIAWDKTQVELPITIEK